MTNHLQELVRIRRLIFIFSSSVLASLIILWFVLPAKSFVAGFFLGGVISLYNVLYLARRVRIAGETVISGTTRSTGTGFANRVLMVAFGIILSYRFPEWLDVRFFVLGLPVSYILIVVAAWINLKRERRDILGNNS